MTKKSVNPIVDTAPEAFGPLFDSHSHINSSEFDGDREAVVGRMRAAGLVGAITIACDWDEIEKLHEVVGLAPGFLYGAWALHPEYEERREPTVEEIIRICSADDIVAVGETGLDYYWCKGDLTWQKERFVRHIEAAKALGKPVIVHAREAEADALEILIAHDAASCGFVLHCFGGNLETAQKAVEAGGLVSFTGVLTFKSAQNLRDVVRELPLEALMIETDCPYMAPVPWRGRRCEPALVGAVAGTIAEVKGLKPAEVARVTAATARRFFHLEEESPLAAHAAPAQS